MGYTTDFVGRFILNRKLDDKLAKYLRDFSDTRHMRRDLPKDKYGVEGEFYVAPGANTLGSDTDGKDPYKDKIIDHNQQPHTQPGLWCQWIPSEDLMGIEWDGGEKFYNYVEWLEYINKNFLIPNNYYIRGRIRWQGEDTQDTGMIIADGMNGIRTTGLVDPDGITHRPEDVDSSWLSDETPPDANISDIFKTGGVLREGSKRRIAGISGEGKNVTQVQAKRISRKRTR